MKSINLVKSLILIKMLKWAAGILGTASIIYIFIFTAIQIPTFGMWFYEYEFEKNGAYEAVNVEKAELLEVTRHMLDYMKDKHDGLNIETTVAGESRLFFSELEIAHMQDVKGLFSAGFIAKNIAYALLAAAVVLFLFPLRKDARFFFKCVLCGLLGVIGFVLIIAVCGIINFDAVFTVFHEIFFTNDMWLLDPDVDLLINILPLEFFIDIAVFIAVSYAAMSLMCMAACFFAKNKLGKQ